jgi:hypothetical protein
MSEETKEVAMSWRPFCTIIVITAALWFGLVSSALAAERPFKAAIAGNAQLSPTDDPCVLRNDETGAGNATHLGQFTWTDQEFANFCIVPGGVAVSASFTMTAADGDQLHGQFTSLGTFDEIGTLVIHGEFQFVGGTGRFLGVMGSGSIDAMAFLSPGLPFAGTMTGTIDY